MPINVDDFLSLVVFDNWGTLDGGKLTEEDLKPEKEEIPEVDKCWAHAKHPPLDSSLMCRATDPSIDKPDMTFEEAYQPLDGREQRRVKALHVEARMSRLTALSEQKATERRERRRERLGSPPAKSQEEVKEERKIQDEQIAATRAMKRARTKKTAPTAVLQQKLGFTEDEVKRALKMHQLYSAKLNEFYRGNYKSQRDYSQKAYFTHIRYLKQAADIADQLQMKYEHYIEAQFYWFYQWRGEPPEIVHLQGGKGEWPAKRRAEEYLNEGRDPDNPKHRVYNTYNSVGKDGLTLKETVQHFNSIIEQQCRTRGQYERALLIQWGHPGADNPYPLAYLVHNEIWQELDAAGMFDGPPINPLMLMSSY